VQYKTESRFRNQLVNEMRLEGFEVQGIESGMTGRGIPDLYFSGVITGWIELKNITGELKDPVVIDFRAGQYEWLLRFHKAGTNVYLMVSCCEGIFVFRGSEIKKSYRLQEFLEWRHLNKMKNIDAML
jgi:hypothetical protein